MSLLSFSSAPARSRRVTRIGLTLAVLALLLDVAVAEATRGDARGLARAAGSTQGELKRGARSRPPPPPSERAVWPEISERYLLQAAQHARRARDLVAIVTIRSLASAKQRLSMGWLPSGSGESARLAGRSAREALQVTLWGSAFPGRRVLFVPLSLALSATSASLLACASVVRVLELASRAFTSVASDLAAQTAAYSEFATAVAAGRVSAPPPLPKLPEAEEPTATRALPAESGPESGPGVLAMGGFESVPVQDILPLKPARATEDGPDEHPAERHWDGAAERQYVANSAVLGGSDEMPASDALFAGGVDARASASNLTAGTQPQTTRRASLLPRLPRFGRPAAPRPQG
ncbi:hypothetical protein T492DRAFT_926453 [Pavlovales sp. CCMP2436]|nr:hypothetical protein T492DRAFT_926453 [Pavlovales sp. CCMP2436]